MQKVLIIGPAHPLRGGGITTFNHRLAKQLTGEGYDCSIVSFSLQYPSILFPGKSQYSEGPAPEGIRIHTLINSINPLNWVRVGQKLKGWKPDLVIVRFWLPFMGPALGTILRRLKTNRHTRVICIADNIIPHEKRPGDVPFTKYFLGACDAFITMSDKVLADLKTFEGKKPALLVPHPLYDNFGEKLPTAAARQVLGLAPGDRIIVFFGFIRRYKGLDILLRAMADSRVRTLGVKLLVAGEFYEDPAGYKDLVREFGLESVVTFHDQFIADDAVRNYICAADCIIQPYRQATQSGVTPLAYHFEKPMIVTAVGGLPALVPHGRAGLVAQPDPASLAGAIEDFYRLGADHFRAGLLEEKQKLSWEGLTRAIIGLGEKLNRE